MKYSYSLVVYVISSHPLAHKVYFCFFLTLSSPGLFVDRSDGLFFRWKMEQMSLELLMFEFSETCHCGVKLYIINIPSFYFLWFYQ